MVNGTLPAHLGMTGALHPVRRDLARIERSAQREVAVARTRAHVVAERGRASVRAVEDVALDAMESGTAVARHALLLANSTPVAEPMLRAIVDQTSLALGRIVADTAKDLR